MPRSGEIADTPVERFFQISILGLMASGYLAVAGSGYLDVPTIALTAAGILLRVLMVLGVARLRIPEGAVTSITLAYIGFFPLDWMWLSGELLRATVHLVFFLAVMKILTARSNRDYVYTAAIAFLELLAAAVLSTGLNFFVWLAVFVQFAVAALASAEIRRAAQKPGAPSRMPGLHARLGAASSLTAIGILVLTAGLFFLLPRTADAAFRHLVGQRYFLPGFSNQVTLGQIGQIKNSSRPVMHVRLLDRQTPIALKFRGAALAQFDGRKWFNAPAAATPLRLEKGRIILASDDQRRRPGARLLYRVDVHNIETDVLFFAGVPEAVSMAFPAIYRTETGSYRLHTAPQDFAYEVYSFIEPAPGQAYDPGPLDEASRRRYLQLPALDPRIQQLAARIAQTQPGDELRARELERYLRTAYGYTLELPQQEMADPLAWFLFERRKGHCEYFASAMTVMLRVLGIPSRLVNGFQGGVWNPVSEMFLVRASDAHTWVEAWLPGRGWTVFDPTPPDPSLRAPTLWQRAGFYLDAAETFWQEWVLSYDLNRQITLAERVETSTRRLRMRWLEGWDLRTVRWSVLGWFGRNGWKLLAALLVCALLAAAAPRALPWWRMRRQLARLREGQASASDAAVLYRRMLEVLRRRGYDKPASITPSEFAATIPIAQARLAVEEFTAAYNELRFGGRAEAAPRLALLLERVERQVQ